MTLFSRSRPVVVAITTALMVGGMAACSSRSAPSFESAAPQAPPSAMAAPSGEPGSVKDKMEDSASLGVLGAIATNGPAASRSSKGGGDSGRAESGGQTTPRPARLVHYNGTLRLRASDPNAALTRAAKLADDAGGYIEHLTEAVIVLRVPVARFREVFRALTTLGTVLSRSMTAQDVTDAFADADLRVRILRASRDRLLQLLARVSSAETKLELLTQVQSLTEQIDQLDRELQSLASLAEFSRISVDLVTPRPELDQQHEEPIAAFRWVHALSPFARTVATQGMHLTLSTPQGMLEIKGRGCFTAESADGAVLWASKRKNTPAGTTEFWLEALRSRLAPNYVEAKLTDLGPYKVLRLVDGNDDNAYRYLVGIRVNDDKIEIVEAYFVSAAQEQRYLEAIRVAVSGGAS